MNKDRSYNSYIYFFEALVPVHVGSGEGTGVADLPIQREAITNYPVINATSWKGTIKAGVSQNDGLKVMENAILSFSDLKLLCFPVKSSYKLFSYVTCPKIINRFFTELSRYPKDEIIEKGDKDILLGLGDKINKGNAAVGEYSDLPFRILEGIKFREYQSGNTMKVFLNLKEKFPEFIHILNRIVVISDDNFEQFVIQSTEKIVRNRLNGHKSIHLFSKEFLPEGSFLYGKITEFFDVKDGRLNNTLEEIQRHIKDRLSIGGDYSQGKGNFKIYKGGSLDVVLHNY